MRRTAALGLALVATGLLATGCGGGGSESDTAAPSPAAGAQVHMAFTLFKEQDVTVKAGEAVTFVNDNPIEHVIVQGPWEAGGDGLRTSEKDDGAFRLTVKDKGERVSHTFAQPGRFEFFCTIHKGMNGAVTVT